MAQQPIQAGVIKGQTLYLVPLRLRVVEVGKRMIRGQLLVHLLMVALAVEVQDSRQ